MRYCCKKAPYSTLPNSLEVISVWMWFFSTTLQPFYHRSGTHGENLEHLVKYFFLTDCQLKKDKQIQLGETVFFFNVALRCPNRSQEEEMALFNSTIKRYYSYSSKVCLSSKIHCFESSHYIPIVFHVLDQPDVMGSWWQKKTSMWWKTNSIQAQCTITVQYINDGNISISHLITAWSSWEKDIMRKDLGATRKSDAACQWMQSYHPKESPHHWTLWACWSVLFVQ